MQIINQQKGALESYQIRFLYPGQIIVSARPTIIKTTLGSCVSVCLWDSKLKIGGMNHFMIHEWNGLDLPTAKYGDIATQRLLQKMVWLGSEKENLKAKLFGGAEGLDQTKYQFKIGSRNVTMAVALLEELKIPVIARSLGGSEGRSLQFHTDSGKALLRFIPKVIYHNGAAPPAIK